MSNSNKVRVDLNYPIPINGAEVTYLDVRRPLVRDMAKARSNKDEADAEVALFADLCQITKAEMGLVDADDYFKIQAVVAGFTSSRKSPAE